MKNHKLTLTGTIRKNKREIPDTFSAKIKERKTNTSIFGFTSDMTLVSYKPKPNKIVLLLSTMHDKDEIDESTGEACKPKIITFYNATKAGVDVVDQLKSNYSVSRKSCRWPLTLFFSMLNIAGINSEIVYEANKKCRMNRRKFLKSLANSLILPQLERRRDIVSLPITIKNRIKEISGGPANQPEEKPIVEGRCNFCSWKKNRKTKTVCLQCQKPICREHTTTSCPECVNK